jgi:integrase/recombinase XerD
MKKNITLSRGTIAYIEHQRRLNYSWRTLKTNSKSLKQLAIYFKIKKKDDIRLADITRKDIERFHDYRAENHARNTVCGDLLRISGFLKWAQRQSYILFSPMQGMRFKVPPRDISKRTITENEVERLLNSIDFSQPIGLRDRAIIELIFSTGIRRSEVVALNLFDVDFEAETVRINQGKGKKDRIVPLGYRAKEWVKKYISLARNALLEGRTEDALFVSNKRGRMTDRAFAKTISARMTRAGLKYASHSLRHGFATALLRRGADITHIQAMLGHASIASTQIYTEVVTEDLRKTLEQAHPGA